MNKYQSEVGFYGHGGNSNTILITLRGAAFDNIYTRSKEAPLKIIRRLKNNIRQLDGKITRIDLALDDRKGKYSIDYAEDQHNNGGFTSRGRPPKTLTYKNDDGGATFKVGDIKNGKAMVVYNKGIKEKAKDRNWVRWELRLSHKKAGGIDINVLVNPGQAFKTSYPVTSKMNISTNDTDITTRVSSVKKNEEIDLVSMLGHCRMSYGPLIGYLQRKRISSELIINAIANDKGPPQRLKKWIGDKDLTRHEVIEILNESIADQT